MSSEWRQQRSLYMSEDITPKAGRSVEEILLERNKTHGDYTAQAQTSQQLKKIVRINSGSLSPVQRDALEMICVKISRILSGDPNHKDSWVDIAGYATLVADRIDK